MLVPITISAVPHLRAIHNQLLHPFITMCACASGVK